MTDSHLDYCLGIISPAPASRDNQGRYWCNHSNGRLWDVLRTKVPRCRLCLPILPEPAADMKHRLDFPTADVVALPPLKSVVSSQIHYFATRRVVRQFARDCDVLFLRTPFQVPTVLRHLGKPKLLHVVGNTQHVVAASTDYHGWMKVLARRFAAHSNATLRRIAAEPQTRVATNGAEMWELLRCRAGRVVVSSCIYADEIRPRVDRRRNDPPRLLFVGYLRPEKGIQFLLEAFESIRSRRNLKLTLVGATDRNATGSEAQFRRRIAASPYRDDITVAGMVEFGEPLFDLYRSHDIFVQPSISEGTPRTLVEARAFGCAVVASRVGGIPSSVRDEVDGLLVPPADSAALATALLRLLDDESLANRLVDAGLERNAEASIEHFADSLLAEIRLLAPAGDAPQLPRTPPQQRASAAL